ncbi:hypothetical protein HHK36_009828 [Tetracentron sinense]|uniref:Uncharacterized protein n=1 Tax=Tetracentron sinense TaxID=13715 RepID=A0A834ZGT8_TETSI|nr:hypothetical protein HHK36_009828 [Tetracentron sinense]
MTIDPNRMTIPTPSFRSVFSESSFQGAEFSTPPKTSIDDGVTGIPHRNFPDIPLESSVGASVVASKQYHVAQEYSSIWEEVVRKYGDITSSCRLKNDIVRAAFIDTVRSIITKVVANDLNSIADAEKKIVYFKALNEEKHQKISDSEEQARVAQEEFKAEFPEYDDVNVASQRRLLQEKGFTYEVL